MSKAFKQITFDFFAPPEEQPAPAATPVAEEPVASIINDEAPAPMREVEIDVVYTSEPEPGEQTPASADEDEVAEEEVIIAVKEKKARTSTRGRRSLKETALSAELMEIPEDEVLFQKQYYAIGEVATMFREKQSLIRYWETEFDILQPRKNRKGDRYFRPVDVKNLALIYDLLRRRKFTIEGAKDFLKKNKKAEEKFAMIQSLEKIRSFFLELKASL